MDAQRGEARQPGHGRDRDIGACPGGARDLTRRTFLGGIGRGAMAGLAGRALLVGSLGSVPLLGGAAPAAADQGKHLGGRASRHGAEVLRDWYATLYSHIMDEGTTPSPAARIYACIGVSAYEAVVGGAPQLVSLTGQLNGLRPPPRASDPNALDWPTVASAAIAATAASVLRNASEGMRAGIADQLASHLDDRASAGIPVRILERSSAHGRRVGEHVAAWAVEDGAEATIGRSYTPPVGEALWRSTPPNFGTAIDPYWGSVRPMALPSASFCAPPSPPATFSTSPDSPFYQQALAVLTAFDALTDEQRGIALFWRDNPITSGLPSGHWMLLVGQLCMTAPPLIWVWRDAEVEPAEPICDVSCHTTATCSNPVAVRASCWQTVTSPWRTSTAAVWTSTPAGLSTTRASA